MTLAFLTVLYAAGFLAWLVDLPKYSTTEAAISAVVAGLGAGYFLCALMP